MARVKIVRIPKAQNGIDLGAGASGTNGNGQFRFNDIVQSGKMSQAPVEARQTLGPVPRSQANLEAEKGETAVLNMGGMPAHFKIGGQRHSKGGTPLNLPDNSFIFSDTAKMKIKDPIIQAQFGMVPKKSGYTPAEIAKKYDINKFRKVLADPDSEDIDRDTAEMMISNYNLKLAKLALIQESIKGFPQGIPVIAMPYIMSGQIDPSEFLPEQAEQQLAGAAEPDADMGTSKYGGGLPKAQPGIQVTKKLVDSMKNPFAAPFTMPVANTAPIQNSITAGAPTSTGSAMTATGTYGLGSPKENQQGRLATEESAEINLANTVVDLLSLPQKTAMYLGTGANSLWHNTIGSGSPTDERGVPYGAKWEMPSEAINMNYPGHENLAFAADFITPSMVTAPIKAASRFAQRAVAPAINKAVVTRVAKAATEHPDFIKKVINLKPSAEEIDAILLGAGKEASEKNIAIIKKAYETASENAINKVSRKPSLLKSEDKLVEKLRNSTLKEASKENIRQIGKNLGTETGEIAEKVWGATKSRAKKIIAPIKEAYPKFVQRLEDTYGAVSEAGPYIGPAVMPAGRSLAVGIKGKNSEKKEPNQKLAPYTDKDGLPLYTIKDVPGQYFRVKKNLAGPDSLLPYDSRKGLLGPGITPEDSWKTTKTDTTNLLKAKPAKVDTTKTTPVIEQGDW